MKFPNAKIINIKIISIIYIIYLWMNYASPLYAQIWQRGSLGENFTKTSILQGTEIFRAVDATQDIRLQTASYHTFNAVKDNLLYFDFETEHPNRLQEQNGSFKVHEARYFPSHDTISGKRAALFNAKNHGVWITPAENFIANTTIGGSFTIEMRFKPLFLHRNTLLLEKINLDEGKRNGIEIGIQNGHVFVNLTRIFYGLNGERFSIQLYGTTLVKLNTWQHLAISYDAAQGRMALYLDGKEESVRFARDKKAIWQLKFSSLDQSYLVLAATYIGLIDDFRIAKRTLSPEKNELNFAPFPALSVNFKTQQGKQEKGVVYSPLNSLPKQQTARFAQFTYLANKPQGTALDVYVRYSKQPFHPQKTKKTWQRVKRQVLNLPVMRYFQWKAVLRSDPLGEKTPVLHGVQLNYTLVQQPPRPQNIRIIHELSKDLSACLEWERVPLQQSNSMSGYHIYYGLRPREYMGRLTYYKEGKQAKPIGSLQEKFPMTNSEKQMLISQPTIIKNILHNRIRLIIDNKLIEKNLSLDNKKQLPLLKAGTNYYFAISTYNDLSESQLSEEVYIITERD